MTKTENFPQVEMTTADALRDWLLAHHAQDGSVWLVTYKKSVPDKYLDRFAVLDQLICFGWIDGIRRVLDDTRTMQLISPQDPSLEPKLQGPGSKAGSRRSDA